MSLAARDQRLAWGMLTPSLAVVAAFAFYPILSSVWLSLHRVVLGLPGLGRGWVGLDNYRLLLGDPAFGEALRNTLVFVALSTSLEVLLGLVMALLLNRAFRGRGLVRAALLVPWALPTVVASQMWRFLFNDRYGLVNYLLYGGALGHYQAWLAEPGWALAALVLADVWKTSAFAALLILAGLQAIPDQLYEAARVDGAGPWRRFTLITWPLLRPALLLALLFRTMDALRVFDLVFVMTQGGPGGTTDVLMFHGYQKMFAEGFLGQGAAVSVVVFLCALGLGLVYLRVLGRGALGEGRA